MRMLFNSFDLDCMIHFLDITHHCNVVLSEPYDYPQEIIK